MKGGCGWRFAGFASTLATRKVASSRSRRKASASSFVPTSRRVDRPGCGGGPAVGPGEGLAAPPEGGVLEAPARLRRERRDERPVFARDEALDLHLPVADEAQGDRLHPPRRARARKLAPEDGREREADEVVEGTPREIGVDQRRVDLARSPHGGLDGVLGDRVEGDALDRHLLQRPLLAQGLDHVPGNGLALAIRVGREDQLLGAPHGLGDVAHPLAALGVEFPEHPEILLGIDRAVLGRQVADMAVGGQDLVVLAQVFVDRLGLGRRLDDDDFHSAIRDRRRVLAQRGRRTARPRGAVTWDRRRAKSIQPPRPAGGCRRNSSAIRLSISAAIGSR